MYLVIVRKGETFFLDDIRGFFDYPKRGSSQHETGNVVINDSEGHSVYVTIGVRESRVYDYQLSEDNVDVVRIAGGEV